MKKALVVLCVALLCCLQVSAQSLSKANVSAVKVRNSGAIIQNGVVKGYYNFYNLEKQDRKNNNYMLSVTDENLREINSVTIVRPNTYLLIEGSFNGEAFGFLFYDIAQKKLELIAYDKTLKEAGKVMKELNKYGNANYGFIAQGNEPMQSFLIAVPNKGFVYYGIKEESKSDYEIEFYNNAMKRVWVSTAPVDDYDFENAAEAFVGDQYMGSLVAKRKAALSFDFEMELFVQDVTNGKALFRIPMEVASYKLALAEVFFDQEKQQFVLFGEYFTKDQNMLKDQSQGFITVVTDMKGKVVSHKTNSWKGDINKLIAAKDKAGFEDTNTLFHDFVRTSDGQWFAIGEQYRKGGSPLKITLNVFNIVIYQFNADLSIAKVHVFEKAKNPAPLPSGMIITSSKFLSYVAKAYGGFDYIFTQVTPDKNSFVVTYINYDKSSGEKGQNILGSIIYTPEKVFTVDKLPLARKSTAYFVYKGKEGYVMVSEYFAKEKRLDSRLEKLNY